MQARQAARLAGKREKLGVPGWKGGLSEDMPSYALEDRENGINAIVTKFKRGVEIANGS